MDLGVDHPFQRLMDLGDAVVAGGLPGSGLLEVRLPGVGLLGCASLGMLLLR